MEKPISDNVKEYRERTGGVYTEHQKVIPMHAGQGHRKPSGWKAREMGDGTGRERLGVCEARRVWMIEWRPVLLTEPRGHQ